MRMYYLSQASTYVYAHMYNSYFKLWNFATVVNTVPKGQISEIHCEDRSQNWKSNGRLLATVVQQGKIYVILNGFLIRFWKKTF